MNEEVTSCCGCSYEDSFVTDCCAVEMHKDEEICPSCNQQTDCTGYICNECGNWTEDLVDFKEYQARIEENYLEERADAKRKYGE